MRALCYVWIDSTVKRLGEGKRRQYFSLESPKVCVKAEKKNVEQTQQNLYRRVNKERTL